MSSQALIDHDEWNAGGPGLIASVRRYRVAVTLFILASMVVGYLVSSTRQPVYEASAIIILSEDPDTSDVSVFERDVQQQANRIESRSLIARASDRLGTPIPLESITVEPDPSVGTIEVFAQAETAAHAARTANVVVEVYRNARREASEAQVDAADKVLDDQGAELAAQVDALAEQVEQTPDDEAAARQLELARAQLLALETRISEVAIDTALRGTGIESVEDAILPEAPLSPQPIRDTVVAGVIGLMLATVLAFWRAGIATREEVDAASILDAPLLAQIPVLTRSTGTTATLFEVEATEAYQFLLTSVEEALRRTAATSILVTSANSGDGKSLTALHLARALAVQGRDVMLVDSDVRARGLTSLLGAEENAGLVALADGAELSDVVRRFRITESDHLSFVPAGQPPEHVAGLLAMPKYRTAIAQIVASSDITIVDSAPILTVADAAALATEVTGILLVLDALTSHEDLLKLKERLRLIPTPVLGYLTNRAPNVSLTYPDKRSEARPTRMGRTRARLGTSRPRPSVE